MLGQSLAFLLSAVTLTLGAPITESAQPMLDKRISQCSGIPAGIWYNSTQLSNINETKVTYSYSSLPILDGSFAYNGHGGAPCAPSFALGISKNETAPTNIVDAGWVDRVAIGGDQSNALVLDSHVISDHYNVFFVQYDPATGDVLPDPNTQSVGKICYRGTYPLQDNPCDA